MSLGSYVIHLRLLSTLTIDKLCYQDSLSVSALDAVLFPSLRATGDPAASAAAATPVSQSRPASAGAASDAQHDPDHPGSRVDAVVDGDGDAFVFAESERLVDAYDGADAAQLHRRAVPTGSRT